MVNVGTCGFSRPKTELAQFLSCVEVQQTFYQPPRLATLENWRRQVPPEFEFTLKAWQLITHEARSPTYKRLKKPLSDEERQQAGSFKPTEVVRQAWQVTADCARALGAKTILFQCPASFKPTRENRTNLERFFSDIDRQNFHLGWEPRGAWDRDLIQDMCHDLNLWHVVDPFVTNTVTPDHCYFRLHGRQGWRYQYEEQELTELVELLPKNRPCYVFFNNVHMFEDALLFKKILQTTTT
ncbi:uncharacterized protein YecE (DUF72 family) [Larkinella arboricola]|uniref:Uncharacterized protein YecE (DUF72 family) n=1 Tax=Larkinella arboricola TaxID=643671 RepID=A0A327X5Y1_LARAB|nr:DUF72 domain-containing protein [Larkinella arboricola]RAK02427.1 uncharacterized protein YecE (DUF72 family) [Larkinella arboricola]